VIEADLIIGHHLLFGMTAVRLRGFVTRIMSVTGEVVAPHPKKKVLSDVQVPLHLFYFMLAVASSRRLEGFRRFCFQSKQGEAMVWVLW